MPVAPSTAVPPAAAALALPSAEERIEPVTAGVVTTGAVPWVEPVISHRALPEGAAEGKIV